MENFDSVYKEYWNYVCSIVRYKLKDVEPNDIAQKAFISLLKQEKQPENIKSWLGTVTVNLCLNYIRHQAYVRNYKNFALYIQAETTAQEDANKELQSEILTRIKQEMDKLPIRSRRAFALYYLHGYNVKQIAKIMNIRRATVHMQIKIARDKLKIALNL